MDKRLFTISKLIKDGVGLADVGTDHGYLPVFLAQNGYSGNIIASDINPSPLSTAQKTVHDAGLEDRINLVLCSGLELISPESIDTIVIAGMGGDLICSIIDAAEWTMDARYRLILQPMTKPEILRYWLSNNDYHIDDEVLVEDSGRIYQVICASFGGRMQLNEAELYMGKYELVCKEILFEAQLQKLISRFEKDLAGLSRAGSSELEAKLRLTELIHTQLLDIRKKFMEDK